LAVDLEDGIAWMMLGLTRLRLADEMRGLENVNGAITAPRLQMYPTILAEIRNKRRTV
jgi:hypothetical protein